MLLKKAIIGGSGLYYPDMLAKVRDLEVETRFGKVQMLVGEHKGEEIVFIPRHGRDHRFPPHLINYRANMLALKKLGVELVLATGAVGSLNRNMVPGDCVVPHQFIDFTKSRPMTFFEGGPGGVVHMDFTEPYCPEIRRAILETGRAVGVTTHDGGVYVCTEGPRFETPAEIRMYATLGGDLVGMTGVPEVVLARELGICYGTVTMVTNFAAGISPQTLTHQEVLDVLEQNNDKLREIILKVLVSLPSTRACACAQGAPDLSGLL